RSLILFLFNAPPPTAPYTLSLHDALPIYFIRTSTTEMVDELGFRAQEEKSELAPSADASTAENSSVSTSLIVSPSSNDLAITRRSEEHTSELQSRGHLVCRLLLEKKKKKQ